MQDVPYGPDRHPILHVYQEWHRHQQVGFGIWRLVVKDSSHLPADVEPYVLLPLLSAAPTPGLTMHIATAGEF